ncbi:MAG: hypothetical protein LBU12_05240 [Deltaproteobacteria bacterium]|jgi:thymidylate synthase|nr:hypothetical protein [Deltaproteobacteria bacterium]
MEFKWAVEAKNVALINPAGTAVVCSLWTPHESLLARLRQAAPEAFDADGPFALAGRLYGGGLNVMLRNLHHNPQIDVVILCGKDFSGASHHLRAFFEGRVERSGLRQDYVFEDGRRAKLEKLLVRGPDSVYGLDGLMTPEMFGGRVPKILDWSGTSAAELTGRLRDFLRLYQPQAPPTERPPAVPLPKPLVETFPADVFGQSVAADTVVEAWSDLLVKISRFGRPRVFRSGKERYELVNLKAVIRRPGVFDPDELTAAGLSPSNVEAYRQDLLKPELDDGLSYTYGHRLRAHFGQDLLLKAAADLAQAGDARHAYLTLWDNARDLGGSDVPCLVSVFFRKIDDLVHLSAVFRSHNAGRAWPVNCLGLHGLTEFVCQAANESPGRAESRELRPGTLTVTSLSISLDPADVPQVGSLLERRLTRPRRTTIDPNGHFAITVDHQAGLIVVGHFDPEGQLLTERRGRAPEELYWELQRTFAVSDLGHALYLGGQLEKAWSCLAEGRPYVQDKARPPVKTAGRKPAPPPEQAGPADGPAAGQADEGRDGETADPADSPAAD